MKIDKKSILRENKLKKISYDKYTKSDLKFLESQWIHNGIWPSTWWRCLRWFTTKLFSFLSRRRHDDWFWKQEWFHKVNYWLLKYSHISLANEYRDICKQKWYKQLYTIPKYHLTLPFKSWIIWWAYNACESKKWKEAYDACKILYK